MRDVKSNIVRCLITRVLAFLVVLLVGCLHPLKGWSQTGEIVVDALVKMGFENVGYTDTEVERVFVLQNEAYRLNGVGIAKAVDVIQQMGLPEGKPCRIVVLDNNVPQISLYYHPVKGDSIVKTERADWNVSYDLGDSWQEVRKVKRKNSSLFKVDILVYPQLSFKNLIVTQVYQALFDLSPAVEVSFWKGMKFTGQLVIPIYNDGYSILENKVHPGHVALSQQFRLPYGVFCRFTAGLFNGGRYGVDFDVNYHFKDERFALLGRIGYSGESYWNGFRWHYDPTMTLTWTLGGRFYWPRYNTEFTVKAEQYLLKEKGIKAEMIRHFRYCSVGLYAMKAKGARSNGGFRFQVALPPYKYKRHKYWPRVRPSDNFGLLYNAGNEQKYYKQYKAEASDNIMNSNRYNPYYIKSEMLNY